jgi:hypothetical protein
MSTPEKCDKPATAAIKIGSMGEFAPVCDKHIATHRHDLSEGGKEVTPEGSHQGPGRADRGRESG